MVLDMWLVFQYVPIIKQGSKVQTVFGHYTKGTDSPATQEQEAELGLGVGPAPLPVPPHWDLRTSPLCAPLTLCTLHSPFPSPSYSSFPPISPDPWELGSCAKCMNISLH